MSLNRRVFTQTIAAPETALIARQVVDEVASLNDRITVEEVNLILDKERSAQFGIDRIPAVVLLKKAPQRAWMSPL